MGFPSVVVDVELLCADGFPEGVVIYRAFYAESGVPGRVGLLSELLRNSTQAMPINLHGQQLMVKQISGRGILFFVGDVSDLSRCIAGHPSRHRA